MRLAVGASAVLMVAGAAAFWWAAERASMAPPKDADQAVTVTIRDNVCDPSEITVPAGRTAFTIINESQRALEWEILDGVMVVEERENIAPGFSQTMTVKLRPGEFDITCGLLSNPRGTLRVTPSAASDAEAARPSLVAYVGPLAEYRVFLALEGGTLAEAAQALAEAIKSGDRERAQRLYVPAHQAYKRIEPMAELFADLDTRLNARADYFEQRESDPGFMGFHRIEYELFGSAEYPTRSDHRSEGSDRSDDLEPLVPVVDQLLADVGELEQRLRALSIPPDRLAGASARLLRRVADHLAAGGEERYAHADAASLAATLEGTKKLADLLAPLLSNAAPDLNQAILRRFGQLDMALDRYREGEEFKTGTLDAAQREALAGHLRALAEDLGKVNGALGLE